MVDCSLDRIKKLQQAYQEQLKKVVEIESELKAIERYGFIYYVTHQFNRFEYIDSDKLFLSEPHARELVLSLVDDLYRIESYHDIDGGIDLEKKASYLGKWLTKVKPLRYSEALNRDSYSREHIEVNELFALQCMLGIVGAKITDKQLVVELRYTLRFRHYNEAIMTMLLRSLVTTNGS